MKYVVSREEMQAIDACSINEYKIPGIILMERASLEAAIEVRNRFPQGSSVTVVAERGNNGGDGLAAGRMLLLWGYRVSFYEIGQVRSASDSYKIQKEILNKLDADFLPSLPSEDPDIWIDAIFGVGLTREVGGVHREVIEELNRRSGYVLSIDVPSGVDASCGVVRGCAVRADLTVTFGFNKIGLLLYPGASLAGEVLVKDIGFAPGAVKKVNPAAVYYQKEDLSYLPQRKTWSNKGTYGKVLLVAGARNMAGAALLAGRAAYRSGCGLVRFLTDEANRAILQTGLPDAILSVWDEQAQSARMKEAIAWADVIGIGPGIGTSDYSGQLVKTVLSEGKVPLVIDADGLNCLAAFFARDEEAERLYHDYAYGMILTPHPGEMSRLTGLSVPQIKSDLIKAARMLADDKHVLVLKDARTVVAGGKEALYINVSGCHGMSVAGSGDVLCGLICGLLAQGSGIGLAARLGVYCHGLAGELAAEQKGSRGMMSSDLPDAVSAIIGNC